MIKLLFTFSLFLAVTDLSAQTILGKWKKTDVYSIKADGTKLDLQKMGTDKMPCINDVVYCFNADGTMTCDASSCGETMKKIVETMNGKTKWSTKGDLVTVSNPMVAATTSKVSFKGNQMTWTFLYSDNPKVTNSSKARSNVIVYKRL